MEFPSDCWFMILGKLNDAELEPVSLVCKEFLSITNNLKQSLKFTSPSIQLLAQLLVRFPCLQEICIGNYHGHIIDFLNSAIIEISRSTVRLSTLKLEHFFISSIDSFKELAFTMRNMKILKCSGAWDMSDRILQLIGHDFLLLEELYIEFFRHCRLTSKIITDNGVMVLASKLKNLRKISLIGNLSDKSIIALSSNCLFLEEVSFAGPMHITQHGIGFLLRNSLNLVSLSVDFSIDSLSVNNLVGPFTIENSIGYARELKVFKLLTPEVDDRFLTSIESAQLPLKEISLYAPACSSDRLFSFFRACQSLSRLCLYDLFLPDYELERAFEHLHNITCIKFSLPLSFSFSSFLRLLKNLPRLERIELTGSCLGGKEDFDIEAVAEYTNVQYLSLLDNFDVDDTSLKIMGRVCPNLRHLLIDSYFVTSEGITEILKRCKKLRELELNRYKDTKIFEAEAEVPDIILEELYLNSSDIDNEGLLMIGMKCRRLKRLVLRGCFDVTEAGIRKTAANCKRLKIVNRP